MGVGAGNSAVVVDLPRCGSMLNPRVPNLVPIPGPWMQRETPGQRTRPNYGHPHAGWRTQRTGRPARPGQLKNWRGTQVPVLGSYCCQAGPTVVSSSLVVPSAAPWPSAGGDARRPSNPSHWVRRCRRCGPAPWAISDSAGFGNPTKP